MITGVVVVKYVMLLVIGLYVVQTAESFCLLPSVPLFHYVLLLQFTMPPGMNISKQQPFSDISNPSSNNI